MWASPPAINYQNSTPVHTHTHLCTHADAEKHKHTHIFSDASWVQVSYIWCLSVCNTKNMVVNASFKFLYRLAHGEIRDGWTIWPQYEKCYIYANYKPHVTTGYTDVAHLLQGSMCCVFRDGILQILVVTRGYLSYCCLSIISNQSVYSPLTSDIICRSLDIFSFSDHSPVNPRDGCVWNPSRSAVCEILGPARLAPTTHSTFRVILKSSFSFPVLMLGLSRLHLI